MRSFLLISPDEALAARLRRGLQCGEVLVRCREEEAGASLADQDIQLVIIDCRDVDGVRVLFDFIRAHGNVAPRTRYVALVSGAAAVDVDIIATIGIRVTAIALADSDSVMEVVRAVLNDMLQSAASAIALSTLIHCLPLPAHSIACAVLGSGLRVSSVKEVGALLRQDRGTVTRTLIHEIGLAAEDIVDLAKASYIVVLLRGSSLPLGSVVRAARFSCLRSLDGLLLRVFALSADDVRHEPGNPDPAWWLAPRVREAVGRRLAVRQGS